MSALLVWPRRKRNRSGGSPVAGRRWAHTYRQRMDAGTEACRNCGRTHTEHNPLTFDHIRPVALTGVSSLSRENATILCRRCNMRKGRAVWHHLISLADEEAKAPPEQRWSTRGRRPFALAAPERVEMARRVLPVLVALHPGQIGHFELAEHMGFEREGDDSRAVLAALRILKRRGLVESRDFDWAATEMALTGEAAAAAKGETT